MLLPDSEAHIVAIGVFSPRSLVVDGSHDVSKEKVKLLGLGAVGRHYDEHHGKWASTCLPIFFALSDQDFMGDAFVQRVVTVTDSVQQKYIPSGWGLPEIVCPLVEKI